LVDAAHGIEFGGRFDRDHGKRGMKGET